MAAIPSKSPAALPASRPAGGAATHPISVTSHRWQFRGQSVHCLRATPQDQGAVKDSRRRPPLVLVHGFGASTQHWRHNVPCLAQQYEVHAFDLLGFGRSAKPTDLALDTTFWRDQLLDYARERVGRPAVFVGNSLGGYVALRAAAAQPHASAGVALLNPMGRFRREQGRTTGNRPFSWAVSGLAAMGLALFKTRVFQRLLFESLRRPGSIRRQLRKVYVDPTNVDEALVDAIRRPALDPGAFAVFANILNMPAHKPVDEWFAQVRAPLLFCWGRHDPWINPVPRLALFREAAPDAKEVILDAGHCPHDEQPEHFNRVLLQWLDTLNNTAMA
ncbi:MAG: alpha/beta fold hydrolase [Synechococcus sp. SB0668_bin_15]|nr:alpha/beta fold hydrolase [Synechococcus sp. SB0668_bin_15]MYC49924.1 alpha/beta fold hydrolase [Synechococcus sp. SB0662_bin_14]